MQLYYCKRKGQNGYIYSCIDGHSFGKHMNKQIPASADKLNYIKLHDWLLLGKQRHYPPVRRVSSYVAHANQKQKQFLGPHVHSHATRNVPDCYQTLNNKLNRKLKKKYHPASAIIHQCLEQRSKYQSAELNHDTKLYPRHLHLYTQQAMDNSHKQIGWNESLLQGFLSVR